MQSIKTVDNLACSGAYRRGGLDEFLHREQGASRLRELASTAARSPVLASASWRCAWTESSCRAHRKRARFVRGGVIGQYETSRAEETKQVTPRDEVHPGDHAERCLGPSVPFR